MSDLKTLRCFNPITGKRDGGYCVWEGAGKCMKCEAADEIERVRAAVAQQAEDDGLWFIAKTAPEAYLQNALRYLHALIEQDARALAALKGVDDER